MKTKGNRKNSVHLVTLGCSKNIYDSEVLLGQLKANSFDVEHDKDNSDAQITIINTCGFIEEAKQESINTIISATQLKSEGKTSKVYVTGCLSERYSKELAVEIPEVDAWFGTKDLPRILKTLKADYKKELVGERLLTTPSHYAYFKIAEGCDRPCSFCAIPLMRGKHKSFQPGDLVNRAHDLAKKGVKELVLIAQDLTFYGLDLNKKRQLSELLKKLSDVEGIEWIRLQYAYPSGFPLDVLDVIHQNEKICNYLDMPLQHISDKMLKSMRRGITADKTNELIDVIRSKVPDIALRTTLITGYPGESESDFELMYNWVEKTKFDRLGVFTYSHEENTHAYLLDDDVPKGIKLSRQDNIMELQSNISFELNKKKLGSIQKVLIDRVENNLYVGRTQYDSPEVDNEVIVKSESELKVGEFYQIEINETDYYDISGHVIQA